MGITRLDPEKGVPRARAIYPPKSRFFSNARAYEKNLDLAPISRERAPSTCAAIAPERPSFESASLVTRRYRQKLNGLAASAFALAFAGAALERKMRLI